MPKVSVITPAFNVDDRKYGMSMSSIEKQTNKDFEWIVVGDGYIDNHFQHWTDAVTEKNYGPSVARNIGFQISSGDIITYLDMGDELAPNRIENLVSMFDKYSVDIVFSAYEIVQNGQPFRFDHFDYIGRHPQYPTAFEYIQLLQHQNISVPLWVAHTRKPFVLAGGFQRGIVCGEDGILWRRMVDMVGPNRGMFSDDVAGYYYVTDNGQSRTQRRFEMGGFAFDGSKNDNGKYLDEQWFAEYNSKGLYD